MKRGKRRRNRSRGHHNHKHPPVTDRRIIPIDDGPLRKRAAADYTRAMAKLDKARAELRSFEQEDRPAFGSWMAATFGALLTELRENARLIAEHQNLYDEVQLEMILGNHRNPARAYGAAIERRQNPRPGDELPNADASHEDRVDDNEEGDDFAPFEEMAAEIPEEDRIAMFEDFLRTVAGINPQRLDDEEYETMFAEFEENMFGDCANTGPARVHGRKKPEQRRDEARIKEIYRNLVRRLHPDVKADGDATVSAMWHDVQEAYEARNLDRLETLLALTEMEDGATGSKASFFQMREALAEIGRALGTIHRSVGEAKRNPAWGFTRNPYHGPLEKRIRRDLEADLDQQRWIFKDLKRAIEGWASSWEAISKKAGKRPKPQKLSQPRDGQSRKSNAEIPETVQTEFSAFW